MNHGTVCDHADSCLSVALHFENQNRTLNSSGNAHVTDVVDISASNSNVRYQIAFHNFILFKKRILVANSKISVVLFHIR